MSPRNTVIGARAAWLWPVAEAQLHGVGDASLGEWREVGQVAIHLRRRLTAREMRDGRIEGVCDVRGTPEFTERIQRMRPFLPAAMAAYPDEALP